jgi:hypothetical protein
MLCLPVLSSRSIGATAIRRIISASCILVVLFFGISIPCPKVRIGEYRKINALSEIIKRSAAAEAGMFCLIFPSGCSIEISRVAVKITRGIKIRILRRPFSAARPGNIKMAIKREYWINNPNEIKENTRFIVNFRRLTI